MNNYRLEKQEIEWCSEVLRKRQNSRGICCGMDKTFKELKFLMEIEEGFRERLA
jgi:hypothetical protein